MAPLLYPRCRRLLLLSLLFFLFVSLCFTVSSESHPRSKALSNGIARRMFELEEENQEFQQPLKKKATKNKTSLIKPTDSSKNQTKTVKSSYLNSSKNQTKTAFITDTEVVVKKLNSTTLKSKKLNSTSTKKPSSSLNLAKTTGGGGKNKTTKATATKDKEASKKTKLDETESGKKSGGGKKKESQPSWVLEDELDDDLVSEFRDLPKKFQQTLIPDLERISTTSKAYITKANKEMTKGFKPYVGNKYAPTIATLLSCAFALIPLLLASLLFNKIKAYFSLQKLLIFIQAYLAIYFSILCLSSFITGVEPLRFFYSTSRSTYLCLQVLQTLAYVLYLLLLVMYLVLVFSTDSGLSSKFLGLAQTFVGFSVGLHYYMTVFHRVVLKQPPKTNWKIHAIYATCFCLISVIAGADRRKKTYLEEGGEEGKKN
ncbi:hypothetical protein LR48_Vigan03g305900 [Vigna angularis]|uniref:Uncharacterized protein n=1 Tax=Phaseolus angularis TaxID=3914 RepID=A0A0L9UAU3_PHAAN|nr:uncharacterized protein LOC108327774 [Vigna angularis]KAG2406785.1 uncharacterized protein HKW66_Vig0060420 [Vigna angularis]KOM39677.1 hypothetical protein LR48_Vigan03g305900 [Vigna angularis]